jgi:hypothetical protein
LGFEVFFQPRYVRVAGGVQVIGCDREVMAEFPLTGVRYPGESGWERLGAVDIDGDRVVLAIPPGRYDQFCHGLMRHAVMLIAMGWGDNAAQVLEWFGDPVRCSHFVKEGRYKVIAPCYEPLHDDLMGAELTGVGFDQDEYRFSVLVAGHEYEVYSTEKYCAFSLSVGTQPV